MTLTIRISQKPPTIHFYHPDGGYFRKKTTPLRRLIKT
jgi:hypothetical protein